MITGSPHTDLFICTLTAEDYLVSASEGLPPYKRTCFLSVIKYKKRCLAPVEEVLASTWLRRGTIG
jgi:hypothetical protein